MGETRAHVFEGSSISYQIHGSGPLVVWTPGAFDGIDSASPVAESLADHGFSVLTWDKPNTQRSQSLWRGDDLYALWSDALGDLLAREGMSSVLTQSGGFFRWDVRRQLNPAAIDEMGSMDPIRFAEVMEQWHRAVIRGVPPSAHFGPLWDLPGRQSWLRRTTSR